MNQTPDIAPINLEEWRRLIGTIVEAEAEPHYRRKFRRYPYYGYIQVQCEINGTLCTQTWNVLQVSAEGISARARDEVPDRLKLTLHFGWEDQVFVLIGRTRHCTQTVGGYKVGIELLFPA